jgi:hypothetical protein
MAQVPYVAATYTTTVTAAQLNHLEQGVNDVSYAPAVRAYHNATQNVLNATATALAFNAERIDQAGNAADTMHDTVTNNSRLTCRYAGVYAIYGHVNWDGSTAGTYRQLAIRVSTTGTPYGGMQMGAPLAAGLSQSVSTEWLLAVNDYVELVVQQDSGGTRVISASSATGNAYACEFGMSRVG